MLIPTLSVFLAIAAQSVDPAALPAASVTQERTRLLIDLPAIDLPAHTGHHGGDGGYPPVVKVELPVGGALHAFRVELLGPGGERLPDELLHHFNLIDPAHRELFLPISRRILAAGKETGPQRLPWLLFGLPFQAGDVWVANAMLHNPTDVDYRGVTTRLVLDYVPESRPWPVYQGYPFQLDVAFPVGDKSFALPPGRSARSYEARPSLPGRIVAVGGHLHEMGTLIELTEVESGKVIWSAAPHLDDERNVVGVPVGRLYGLFRVGVRISPERTYRVTVHYDNPTGQTIDAGGMGVIGGLFLPDRGTPWPSADRGGELYLADARHYLRLDPAAADHSAHKH